jgi:diguanylate cyclase (GGDEF)-like protein
MLHIITLILLSVFIYFSLKRILSHNLIERTKNLESLKNKYGELLQEEKELKTDNSVLGESVSQTVALYDIIRDICKTLKEDELFSIFKERIVRYIEAEDLRFINPNADLSQFRDYLIFPLLLENRTVGYLAARGIKEQDKDKFHILGQEYTLGLKRVLLYQKVQELAIIDELTNAFTRRHFMNRFNEELRRSKKFNHILSFLMVDIDHFKEYNDRYGHLVGDAILKEVGKIIKECIRQIDFIGRYGGEEFSVILVETNKDQARFAAERIRRAVESKPIAVYDEDLRVTISIGISVFPLDGSNPQKVIDKADEALYLAKQQGRNRVCMVQSGVV